LRKLIRDCTIFSLSADEVTAIDMTCWVSVHVHVMEGWERVPHLLHILYVSEPGTTNHLTERIMLALINEGGLTREEIASKLVCFGADGVSTFQGYKSGVTTQIREKYAPFILGIHCFSHKMNLAVQTMSKYPMVARIESMLQSLHGYFCRSNKRYPELQKLANLMETKGNKVLRNVSIRWVSMRSPALRVLSKYKTLIVKMGLDMTPAPNHRVPAGIEANFDYLVDLEVLLSLCCIMPLLNAVNRLIKLLQARDVFICDFLEALKLCQQDLAQKYIDPASAFSHVDFSVYHEVLQQNHAAIPMKWKECKNTHVKFLYFDFGIVNIFARCHDKQTGECGFVTPEELNRCQDNIQRQFSGESLIWFFFFLLHLFSILLRT
jgi:hypothetical protein